MMRLRLTPVPRQAAISQRLASSVARRFYANLRERPGPIPLPKKDQEEFERLQHDASVNPETSINPAVRETYAEFEGEKNPQTGEVGGPKQDPTRHGDWAFNGRVTDF